jgi:hypothetical protein
MPQLTTIQVVTPKAFRILQIRIRFTHEEECITVISDDSNLFPF